MELVGELLSVALRHGLTLIIGTLGGLFFWGSVSALGLVLLYLVATHRGWVDVRRQRTRVGRALVAVGLAVVVWPCLTLTGGLVSMRNASLESVRNETERTDAAERAGAALVAPAVAGHLVAQGKLDPDDLSQLTWERLSATDAAFLTRPIPRARALHAVQGEVLAATLDRVPGQDLARRNRVTAWLLDKHRARIARTAGKGLAKYDTFFDGLKADERGRLSFAAASRQVGAKLVVSVAKPVVHEPFDEAVLWLVLFIAAGLIMPLLIVQTVGRIFIHPRPPGSPCDT